jgi:glycosyl transferase family 25
MQPPIFVINLDRDAARLAHMHEQLRRLGLAYERFAALRGDALPLALLDYFPPRTPLTAGEIGCYASHLAIMRRVLAEGHGCALVLEDDVGLPADFARVLAVLVEALPAEWDIVRLSYPTKRVVRAIAPLGGADLVRYTHVPVSTGAYLISASGARRFIDHDLRRVWVWNLDTYGVAPPPVRADVLGQSSIDDLSLGARDPKRRSIARRRQFSRERFARFARGAHDFGLGVWITAEALNLAARLTPRRYRSSFFAWARQRLA